jgi:hypothetical protein
MELIMKFYICVGLCAVGSAFIVLLPTVGQTLSVIWSAIFAEQAFARFRGKRPASDQDDHSLETQLKNAG